MPNGAIWYTHQDGIADVGICLYGGFGNAYT
jgi:hypothetical protein